MASGCEPLYYLNGPIYIEGGNHQERILLFSDTNEGTLRIGPAVLKTAENVTPMPISQAINLFTPLIIGQNYTSHPAETVLLKVRRIFVVKRLADHSLDLLH